MSIDNQQQLNIEVETPVSTTLTAETKTSSLDHCAIHIKEEESASASASASSKDSLNNAIQALLNQGKSIEDVAKLFTNELNRVEQEQKEAEAKKKKDLEERRNKQIAETDFKAPLSQSPLLNEVLSGLNEDVLTSETMTMLMAFYIAQNVDHYYGSTADIDTNAASTNKAFLKDCQLIVDTLALIGDALIAGARDVENPTTKEELADKLGIFKPNLEFFHNIWRVSHDDINNILQNLDNFK